MKRNRFSLLTAGMVCLLLISCSDRNSGGKADRWVHYGTSPDGSQKHYDRQSITTVSPKVVKVWDRTLLSTDARNKVIEVRKRTQLPVDGWDKLNSVRVLREMDCDNRTYKLIRVEDNNERGGTIYEENYQNPKAVTIPPGTLTESLLKEVCPK